MIRIPRTELSRSIARCILMGLILAGGAEAQNVTSSGTAPVTDVSGTVITSGDMVAGMFMGQPGPVQSFFCAEATGVRNAGHIMVAELEQDGMWVLTRAPGVRLASTTGALGDASGSEERQRLLPASIQSDLLEVLTDREDAGASKRALVQGLTPPSNNSPTARRAAEGLSDAMSGLLAAATEMDPHNPGYETATRLTRTVSEYNTFLNVSSDEFVSNPTDELLAIEAIISAMVVAALDNRGNPAACGGAIPALPVFEEEAPPPPPAPERVLSVCLFTDGDLRNVAAIHLPLTGETLVAVNGERRPISEVYPEHPSLSVGAELAGRDEPIQFREREYLKMGLPQKVNPDELTRVGEVDGVPIFQYVGAEAPAEVIYIPVATGCAAQPFQLQELVRQVQG